jgi:putative phosphoribosyl transferase
MSQRRPGRFSNRHDAGRQLAALLQPLAAEQPVVIGLPRGGVPVAEEIAAGLGAVLEVLAVRKIGSPGNPEYGIGAIVEDGTRVLDRGAVAALDIDSDTLEAIVADESAELRRRVEAYRGARPAVSLRGRTVVVVDDGVATGVTDTAALRATRRRGPRRLVLAVPVCAPDSAARLRAEADELVCLIEPEQLFGVGQWYEDFAQVSDAEVLAALQRAAADAPGKAAVDRRFPSDGAGPHRS